MPSPTPTLCRKPRSSNTKRGHQGQADEDFPPPILSVIALWSDNVLIFIVDTLECVVANSGAAVTDVLPEVAVERVTNVVVLGEAEAELLGLEEAREEDEEEDAEDVVVDVIAAALIVGDEGAGVLTTG